MKCSGEFNGSGYENVKYCYVKFDTANGKSRGHIGNVGIYRLAINVGEVNMDSYPPSNKTKPASYFNITCAYHGPDTTYKKFDDTLASTTTVTIPDCVKYDPVNKQYRFWVEFNSGSGIKRGYLTGNRNSFWFKTLKY